MVTEMHTKALSFAQVLQYFKDGVVHVSYSVPYFQPVWVKPNKENGPVFLGSPRESLTKTARSHTS